MCGASLKASFESVFVLIYSCIVFLNASHLTAAGSAGVWRFRRLCASCITWTILFQFVNFKISMIHLTDN